ncbi:MAG: hypothetical protein IJH63_05495 [Methanobrevibacter sp.]|nr:hypothetical protein [Methanobrevibacter sp.]MBR0370160.1 hypothetical protein [Methanobrevibacter sp.]
MNFKIADSKFKELLLPTLLIVMALNVSAVVDSFFVGAYIGKNAVAALEVLEPMILLITVVEWLFGLGGQILALNKKSEFDIEGSNRYFTASIASSLVVSCILAFVCLFFMDPLSSLLGASPTIKPLVMDYSHGLYGCFIVSTIAGVLAQYIRVDGQPNFASVVIIVANLVNVFLDFVFLDLMGLGMAYASLATFIGYSVGIIVCIKYFRDSRRTFRFIKSALKIKTWVKTTWEMTKVGFPGASIGFFDLVFVYVLNIFLVSTLGDTGLTTYMVCMDALVIASIIDIGIAETLTSIVPIYYTKHDYVNLNHLIRTSLIITVIFATLFVAFLWIWPQGFLALYGFNNSDIAGFIINALRLYSIFFVASILPNMLIFYYEAIERSTISTIFSIIFTLVMPLSCIYLLYQLIGSNGIWIAFTVASIITFAIIFVTVMAIQKRDKKYSGLFFIEKDLIPKTRNYVLTDNDVAAREESLQHLKSLNASDEFCDNVNKMFDAIFDTNEHGTYVEMLVIDYDDNVHVDVKYDGEKENLEIIKKKFPENLFKYAEVLGFNNIEYVMDKS